MDLINKYGPWVTGDAFFDREEEVRRLTELINEGNNLLIVAPRRVGKTSLVRETFRRFDIRNQAYSLFVDLQDCSKPEDVIVSLSIAIKPYKKLWNKVCESLQTILKHIESINILDNLEITLRDGLTGDWRTKGDKIFQCLAKADRPVTICFDELPIMISRLLGQEDHELYETKRQEADVFLSWLRLVMQQYQDRLRFIICGSIGLEPILRRHHLSHTITQLRPFPFDPWDRKTATLCLKALAERYGMDLQDAIIQEMLNRLRSFIPHHVQMFFGHLHDYSRRAHNLCPTIKSVQDVYQSSMLGTRGHAELMTYDERLSRVLEPLSVPLALDLLTEAAVSGGLKKQSARLLMERMSLDNGEELLREVLDVLKHDGYLEWNSEADAWQFVSYLVKDWWKTRFELSYRPLSHGR